MRHAAQTVEQAPVNSALLNVVTPMGLSFEKNRLSIGENIGKAYGIIRYPQKVDVEWLSKLTNIPSTLVSIGFKPVDNGTLINALYIIPKSEKVVTSSAKSYVSSVWDISLVSLIPAADTGNTQLFNIITVDAIIASFDLKNFILFSSCFKLVTLLVWVICTCPKYG